MSAAVALLACIAALFGFAVGVVLAFLLGFGVALVATGALVVFAAVLLLCVLVADHGVRS